MSATDRTKYRIAIVGLLTVIVSMMIGFAISSAVVDAGNGGTNVCYSTKNGKLRAAVSACKRNEVLRTIGGSPKSYAASNPASVSMTDGSFHTVASFAVPAGTYVVNASVKISNNDTVNGAFGFCRTSVLPSTTIATGAAGVFPFDANGASEMVGLTGRTTLTGNGTIALICRTLAAFPNALASDGSLTAISVTP